PFARLDRPLGRNAQVERQTHLPAAANLHRAETTRLRAHRPARLTRWLYSTATRCACCSTLPAMSVATAVSASTPRCDSEISQSTRPPSTADAIVFAA